MKSNRAREGEGTRFKVSRDSVLRIDYNVAIIFYRFGTRNAKQNDPKQIKENKLLKSRRAVTV